MSKASVDAWSSVAELLISGSSATCTHENKVANAMVENNIFFMG